MLMYFKINISEINDIIERYKEIKINCLEDINLIYNSLGNTDSAWNDLSAYAFKERIKKDKYSIVECFSRIDNFYNEINLFKSNISNICYKYGCKKNGIVKYDDNEIISCKRHLSSCLDYLNDCLYRLNSSQFDFEYISYIYELKVQIRNIINFINNLMYDIEKITRLVSNEVVRSKVKINKIDNSIINIPILNYSFKIQNVDLKN